MSKQPIKSIQCVTQVGAGERYEVGHNGVTLIKDQSIEYPDAMHFCFGIYAADTLVAALITCPVEVVYAKGDTP